MNSKEFKEKLTSVTPDVPEHFHLRTERTLENIVSQEAHMKESTKKAIRTAGRYSTRTIVLAAALAVMVCAAALAATHWHVFDSLSFMLGTTPPPAADSLMQSNLYQDTVNHVEITVREAGYDGRTLLVQYSYRMLDVDEVYGVTAAEAFGENLPEGVSPDTILEQVNDSAFETLDSHHVGWNFDQLWINGQGVDMPTNSGGVYSGSKTPGEIIYTEYWRLDNEGVFLHDGINQITLPIGASVDAETRRGLADQETKMYRMPESGVITFDYEVKDIVSKISSLSPNEEKVLQDVTAKVTDATFSPLMTYITLDLKVNPDSLAAFIKANGEGPKNEEGEVMWPYGGMDVFQDWVCSLELVDGQGKLIFPGYAGQNGYGNEWAEFLYPHLETMPAELYLAPIEDGVADMSQAVLVKPMNQQNE